MSITMQGLLERLYYEGMKDAVALKRHRAPLMQIVDLAEEYPDEIDYDGTNFALHWTKGKRSIAITFSRLSGRFFIATNSPSHFVDAKGSLAGIGKAFHWLAHLDKKGSVRKKALGEK